MGEIISFTEGHPTSFLNCAVLRHSTKGVFINTLVGGLEKCDPPPPFLESLIFLIPP